MRATSERRRASRKGRAYVGAPGAPLERKLHDYEGDGPSFLCGECGARVSSYRKTHAPGGGKSTAWSKCGQQPVASDFDILPRYTEGEAAARYLVTQAQIAKRFEVDVKTIQRIPMECVARLDNRAGTRLYYAPAVEASISKPGYMLSFKRRTA